MNESFLQQRITKNLPARSHGEYFLLVRWMFKLKAVQKLVVWWVVNVFAKKKCDSFQSCDNINKLVWCQYHQSIVHVHISQLQSVVFQVVQYPRMKKNYEKFSVRIYFSESHSRHSTFHTWKQILLSFSIEMYTK